MKEENGFITQILFIFWSLIVHMLYARRSSNVCRTKCSYFSITSKEINKIPQMKSTQDLLFMMKINKKNQNCHWVDHLYAKETTEFMLLFCFSWKASRWSFFCFVWWARKYRRGLARLSQFLLNTMLTTNTEKSHYLEPNKKKKELITQLYILATWWLLVN